MTPKLRPEEKRGGELIDAPVIDLDIPGPTKKELADAIDACDDVSCHLASKRMFGKIMCPVTPLHVLLLSFCVSQ